VAETKSRESSASPSHKAASVSYSDFSTKRPASHPKKPHASKAEEKPKHSHLPEVPKLKGSLKKSVDGKEGGVDTSRSLSSIRNKREDPFSQTMPQEPDKSEHSRLSRSMRSSSSVKKVSFDIPVLPVPEQSSQSRGKSETAREGRNSKADGLQPSFKPGPSPGIYSPEKADSINKPPPKVNSSKKNRRSSIEKRLVFELSISKENKNRGSVEFYHPSSNNESSFVNVPENQFETLGGQHIPPKEQPKQPEKAPKSKSQKKKPKEVDRALQVKKNDSNENVIHAKDTRKKENGIPVVEFKPVRTDQSRKKVPATFTREEGIAKPTKSSRPEPPKEKNPPPKWNGSSKVEPPIYKDVKPQPIIQELTHKDTKKEEPADRSASRKSNRSQASNGKNKKMTLEEEWALKKPQRNPRKPPAKIDPATLPPGRPR
jgi:hypothetical protein